MGQYHLPVNLDRHEYIHPHRLGDGLKLVEFGASGMGTMFGLAVLLAGSNGPEGRGGGDLHNWREDPYGDGRTAPDGPTDAELLMKHIVGRWAGERIAIVGDYFEEGDVEGLSNEEVNALWNDETWTDISSLVRETIRLDQMGEKVAANPWASGPVAELQPDGTITVREEREA